MASRAPSAHPEYDPELVDVQMNLVRSKEPVTGRLLGSELCMNGKSASFVRHITVDVSGTALAGNVTVGQSLGVIAPGIDHRGKPHKVRLYSIACPSWGEDGEGQVLSMTVKRDLAEHPPNWQGEHPDDHRLYVGACSNFLCDAPQGAEIQITGPAGKSFLLPREPESHNFLFVAAGTGVAPFRGMLKELFERPGGPIPGRVSLVTGSPYRTDLLYHDTFTALAEQHDNFDYEQAISRESGPEGHGEYTHHLINRRMHQYRTLLDDPKTLLYVCGIDGMQTGLFRTLAFHGLADHYVRLPEGYSGTDPNQWPAGGAKRRIKPTARTFLEVY
jgi:ferredoxin--NADP+ reductase